MAPKLYGIVISPPVRAVLMCAKELNLELSLVIVDLLALDHLKQEFVQKNPQCTVPLLEEEDGFMLGDSHAIMGYLVAQYGQNDLLYPKGDNRLRARIDQLLHFDSSVLFVRGLNVSKPFIFDGVKPTKESLAPLHEAFQILDKILSKTGAKFATGDSLTIADFSLVTTLTSWGVLLPYDDFPHITSYVENMRKLSCYDVNKEGLESYKRLIADTCEKINN